MPPASGACAPAVPSRPPGRAAALACLVSGAAVPLAFAPWELPWVAVVALAALFHFWTGSTPAAAFVRGFLFGLGMFGVGVGWLHISMYEFGGMSLPEAGAATLAMVAYLSLYPAAVGWSARRLGRIGRAAHCLGILPALWTLGEWSRDRLLTGFPWLHLGYSQTDTPLARLAADVGVFGVSWCVATFAGALLLLCTGDRRERVCAAAASLLLAATVWAAALPVWARPNGVTLKAALIQGAIPQQLKWREAERLHSLAVYRGLTAPLWDSDIVVWPETAIPAFRQQIEPDIADLAARAAAHGTDLYVGLPTLDEARSRYYNSVYLLNRADRRYDKRHLVPFGEYFPMAAIMRPLLASLDIPMSDFTAGGPSKPVLEGTHAIAGISICYEDAFGEEVIDALPEAQVLINVSNDAWFGDSAAPHQHLQMARMRALETGRYVLRATNTGVSAVIDPRGRVVARSPQFVPAALSARIELMSGLTPYARFGNAPIVAGALLAIVLLAFARRHSADSPAP